jgi:hypothetical protein
MKSIKKGIILILGLVLVSFTVFQNLTKEKDLIIGTWISKDSPKSKWVFKKDGKCYDYYDGKLDNIYYYSINTTSPQCSQKVLVGELYSYLKIKNIKDNNDFYCYEIISLDKIDLQLRLLDRGGFIYFKKE